MCMVPYVSMVIVFAVLRGIQATRKNAQSDGSVFKVCFGTSAPRRCTYDGARDGTPEACVDVARSLLGHRFEGQFPAQRRIDGPSVSFLRQVSRRADFGAVGRPAPLPAGPWTR